MATSKTKFLKKDANGDLLDNINNYVRIGSDYFRVITKEDRFGINRTELKPWKKDEIKTDFGANALKNVRKFADFTINPSNTDYRPSINGCYNLYRPFCHRPHPGEWTWTEILLRHIFGDQYELGIRYMQILYLHPCQLMPILVLVSRERQTGKTTFINWLNMTFGDNMANITPDDLINGFNSTYASSNIIAVEETLIEKALTVEKVKALATSKFISVNQKHVSQYKIPFYGKIILTSNNEDKFARIDDEEIRFFIRKVGKPEHRNHNIEADLVAEIPAFLHHLATLPPVDFSVDRSCFTPEELDNKSLEIVKSESKTWLYKSLRMYIEDLFMNELRGVDEFKASVINIKEKFYENKHDADLGFIRSTLKNEFKLSPVEMSEYYSPFTIEPNKQGRPYIFKREDFVSGSQVEPNQTEDVPF